jgi:glycosyltransferase involved in cell wall biosynthesis
MPSIESAVPPLSVITVCFNSARTIRKTLASVATQQLPGIEYIVIDGGSTDGTLEILAEHAAHITTLVSEPDQGVYDAMNKGLGLARGKWIHILNSDDYYATPDALVRALPLLDPERTNYFEMWREYPDGSRQMQSWDYRRWRLFVSAFLPHPGLIVSRAQYNAVGLYDTNYRIAADHDMILRLTQRWPGLKHTFPLTVMLQGGLSESNMNQSLHEFRAITESHGLPRLLAGVVLRLKRIWWGR